MHSLDRQVGRASLRPALCRKNQPGRQLGTQPVPLGRAYKTRAGRYRSDSDPLPSWKALRQRPAITATSPSSKKFNESGPRARLRREEPRLPFVGTPVRAPRTTHSSWIGTKTTQKIRTIGPEQNDGFSPLRSVITAVVTTQAERRNINVL